MDFVFAAYSKRFLISRLKHGLPYNISRSGARSIRVLWYMYHMGSGWLTFRDLSRIGAGQYKALQYAIPDLVKDGLVDEIEITRKHGKPQNRYKINSHVLLQSGLSYFSQSANYNSY